MKNKVLLFTTRFSPHVGGVENVVENIIKYTKCNVDILTSLDVFDSFLQKVFPIKKELSQGNNIVYRVWMNIPRSIFGILIFPLRGLVSIVAILLFLQKNKYKVVNYHYPDDSISYFLISHFIFRFKYIVNIHGNDIQINSQIGIYKYLFKVLFEKATYIVVNSEYMKIEVTNRYLNLDSKIKIISNGIDLDYYKNIKDVLDKKDKYIFAIGRIVDKKGFDFLLKAFAVCKSRENLSLFIEGKGEDLVKIKSLSKTLKLGNKVKFFEGNLSESQKIIYMKNALMGIIPSRIEPFGIVALEFMASGTPLIATKTGGLLNLIDGKNTGLNVNVDDVNDLASKIDILATDSELRSNLSYGEFNYVKEYDIKVIAQKYDSLYQELLEI